MYKPTVLIVDDDNNVCDAMRHVIEQCDCLAISSSSFAQALENAHLHRIDFAITDWDLNNEKSGVDVGRLLQRINPKLPLVFITGNSARELRTVADDLNIHCILEKPVEINTLRSLIAELRDFSNLAIPNISCNKNDNTRLP